MIESQTRWSGKLQEKRKGVTHLSALRCSQVNSLDPMPPRCEENVAPCQGSNVKKCNHIRRREDDVGGRKRPFRIQRVGGGA